MWTRNVSVALIALVIGSVMYAHEKRKPTLTAQDYVEIQQLYVAYAWAIDTKADNGMVYARTFTTDGEFYNASADKTFVGHAQIAELNRGTGDGRPSPIPTHFNTNIAIEPSPEGARGAAYLLVTGGGPGAQPRVGTIGTYKDILVKTSDGWRFKRRTLYLNAMPPSNDAREGKQ